MPDTMTTSAAATQALPQQGPGHKMGGLWGYMPVQAYLDSMPGHSEKSFENRVLATRPLGGVRAMRLYAPTMPHYHTKSDAVIYVLSGRGIYRCADSEPFEAGPGTLMYWAAGTPHCLAELPDGEPTDILIFDVGVRDVNDIVFLDPRHEGSFLHD